MVIGQEKSVGVLITCHILGIDADIIFDDYFKLVDLDILTDKEES